MPCGVCMGSLRFAVTEVRCLVGIHCNLRLTESDVQVLVKCEDELEVVSQTIKKMLDHHDQLAYDTGVTDGIRGQALTSSLNALEDDLEEVNGKAEELDDSINSMLKELVKLANQGQSECAAAGS